jgi:hypothetical protein
MRSCGVTDYDRVQCGRPAPAAFTFRIEVSSQDGNAGTHLPGYTNLEHYNIKLELL